MDDVTPKENDECKKNDFGTPSINKVVQSFTSQQSVIDTAMAVMARQSALEKALQTFASQQSVVNTAMAAMARPSALEKAMQSFAAQHKAMAKLAGSSNLEHALKSFATANLVFLTEPSYLSKLAKVVSPIDLDSINISSIERELESTESEFRAMENRADCIRVFSKLSPLIQAILLFISMQVFLPQINSILANLITPIVENYLESSKKTDKQKIKEIKKISLRLEELDTADLRFITGNNVRLRANPSTKSEIYDELVLGQVVTVLNKKKNWIEVTYEYEDKKPISGWVFTRYTAKFVK